MGEVTTAEHKVNLSDVNGDNETYMPNSPTSADEKHNGTTDTSLYAKMESKVADNSGSMRRTVRGLTEHNLGERFANLDENPHYLRSTTEELRKAYGEATTEIEGASVITDTQATARTGHTERVQDMLREAPAVPGSGSNDDNSVSISQGTPSQPNNSGQPNPSTGRPDVKDAKNSGNETVVITRTPASGSVTESSNVVASEDKDFFVMDIMQPVLYSVMTTFAMYVVVKCIRDPNIIGDLWSSIWNSTTNQGTVDAAQEVVRNVVENQLSENVAEVQGPLT